jgi:hypothetical protein
MSSDEFIGAKPLDWWAIKKIIPECYISYEYIPLAEGLYIDTDNNIQKFYSKPTQPNVKKIIKEPFTELEYPEYYETISYKTSGANASSVLIDIAEQLGLMVGYKEHNVKKLGNRSNMFKKYVWFEPDKNEHVSNLEYDPFHSIQSFSLSQDGNSLTTILNVSPSENGDELISLFSDIPAFFASYFTSPE